MSTMTELLSAVREADVAECFARAARSRALSEIARLLDLPAVMLREERWRAEDDAVLTEYDGEWLPGDERVVARREDHGGAVTRVHVLGMGVPSRYAWAVRPLASEAR